MEDGEDFSDLEICLLFDGGPRFFDLKRLKFSKSDLDLIIRLTSVKMTGSSDEVVRNMIYLFAGDDSAINPLFRRFLILTSADTSERLACLQIISRNISKMH